MRKATASTLRPAHLSDIDLHCPEALAAEVVAVDEDGRMFNPGYLDHWVATFTDRVPVDVIFAPVYEDSGPSGAKTIAEPPLIPVAACVASAIHDALGMRQYRLRTTPERVWR